MLHTESLSKTESGAARKIKGEKSMPDNNKTLDKLKGTATEGFNRVVKYTHENAVKMACVGGFASYIPVIGTLVGLPLLILSGAELLRRKNAGEDVWTDPDPDTKQKQLKQMKLG
ncbi:MAG: hypothetical protein V1721_02820 [Pseudomonadota bacterium]